MTKDEAKAEIERLNKIAEVISPEYLRLQGLLNIISSKIQYCQGINDGKPVKTSEEAIVDAEKEFGKPVEPQPAPKLAVPPLTPPA